jgi:hypothetical protein
MNGCNELNISTGSHPRVEAVLHEWLSEDAHGKTGLFLGNDEDKAKVWQKAASKLERLARQLEGELSSANAEHTDAAK